MSAENETTGTIQAMLDRLASGDEKAADDLINYAMERLRRLTRSMLRDYKRVRRWEETDDVMQNASMRLYRSLKAVKPKSERHFMNLAATQIQRELIDLARHHFGPHGDAGNYKSSPMGRNDGEVLTPLHEREPDTNTGPVRAAMHTEFHEQVAKLPEEEREMFHMLFYLGLDQAEAAKQLGISVPTVKRRWRMARVSLKIPKIRGPKKP